MILTSDVKITKYIAKPRLIVWDKCSTISKHLIETVDRTFCDILKVNAPFGSSRLAVFGGDFCQVLPVIQKTRSTISQCLNKANFWPNVVILRFEVNM